MRLNEEFIENINKDQQSKNHFINNYVNIINDVKPYYAFILSELCEDEQIREIVLKSFGLFFKKVKDKLNYVKNLHKFYNILPRTSLELY